MFASAVLCVVLVFLYFIYKTLFAYKPYNDGSVDIFQKLPILSPMITPESWSISGKNIRCHLRKVNDSYLSKHYDSQCVHSCKSGSSVRLRPNMVETGFSIPSNIIFKETDEHRKDAFSVIYRNGGWGNVSSGNFRQISGPGSNLNKTVNIQATLSAILDEIKSTHNRDVVRMLDIPCGDFTWMRHFLSERNDVIYGGGDTHLGYGILGGKKSGIWDMRAKKSGIWDMGKSSGIWDIGVEIINF